MDDTSFASMMDGWWLADKWIDCWIGRLLNLAPSPLPFVSLVGPCAVLERPSPGHDLLGRALYVRRDWPRRLRHRLPVHRQRHVRYQKCSKIQKHQILFKFQSIANGTYVFKYSNHIQKLKKKRYSLHTSPSPTACRPPLFVLSLSHETETTAPDLSVCVCVWSCVATGTRTWFVCRRGATRWRHSDPTRSSTR